MSNHAVPVAGPTAEELSAKDDLANPVEGRADPVAAVAELIRADARRAPREYARDSEVPGGGE